LKENKMKKARSRVTAAELEMLLSKLTAKEKETLSWIYPFKKDRDAMIRKIHGRGVKIATLARVVGAPRQSVFRIAHSAIVHDRAGEGVDLSGVERAYRALWSEISNVIKNK
jgi:hypothetical protein